MATTVYDVEVIKLQNGTEVQLKPLTIKELRKFMVAISKTSEALTEDATLDILIDACAVALENAASVAGTILLTEAVVVDKPEENKNDDGLGGMMGMM